METIRARIPAVAVLFCIPLLAALPSSRTARAQSLSGHVRAVDNTPIVGASVSLPAMVRGGITDRDGFYRIEGLPRDTVTVAFSFVGFERVTRLVDLRDGDVSLDVVLLESVEALGEITVLDDGVQAELTRAPQSVQVLEAADLAVLRGQTLGQTLDRLPGVTTLSTGPSIQKPVIRGLHSDRVVIVRNGIAQEGQQWGAEHAPEIDPFAPDRIEVVRGAAGVEYGAGAIGGAVRIDDEALPTTPGFGGRVMVNAYSNNMQGAGSIEIFGSPAAVPGLGLRAQGSMRRAGDSSTPDYVLRNTGFFERSGELAAGYSRGGFELEAHVSHYGTDLGVYRGAHFNTLAALDTVLALGHPPVDYEFAYEIGAPKQVITHDIAAIRGEFVADGGSRLEVHYGFQNNHRQEFDADRIGGRDPLARPAFDLTLISHTAEAKFQMSPFRVGGSTAFAVFGLSGMNQSNRSEVGYLIPNFRANVGGVFARSTLSRGPWTFEAGLRLDRQQMTAFPRAEGDHGAVIRSERAWTGLSGAVGVIRQLGESWSISSNASVAWRPPSVNELFSYGVHHGTAQFEVGNAALGAETSVGIDATVRHVGSVVRAEGSAYVNRMADYIFVKPSGEIVVTIRGVFPSFAYEQVDAILAGFDGGFEVDVLDALVVDGTVSVLRGTDTESDMPLLQMPADRVGLGFSWRFPDYGFIRAPELDFGSTLVRRQDRYPTRADFEGGAESLDYAPPPDGYVLFDAGLHAELLAGGTAVMFSLGVENVFDVSYRDYLSRYRYFAHDVGRNVVLRLQVPFGSHE